jgi:transglutaminase-like putative cysteine protease
VVVSPLVEQKPTLVDQGQFELFSVAVPEEDRDYWRLMSLDEYDGDLWKQSSSFGPADGLVASALDPSVPTRSVVQTVTTTDRLGNIYLPHARELSRVIEDCGIALGYETESGALVVSRESSNVLLGGFSYQIESAVPVMDGSLLRQSSSADIDAEFLDHNTELPSDLPASIRAEAERITADATGDFERALALQDHLRGFAYNIDVALRHDAEDLEIFLLDVHEGYCEQFASAFAVMARSIGLPARVAVGFTWGDWDEARGAYVVRGEHAHAWPEVYFAGTGWVSFEPTPGRGAPGDVSVTGLDPAQSGSAGGD